MTSRCRGCATYFESGSYVEATFCSRNCRENERRRLLGPQTRSSPPAPTVSIARGFEYLADESAAHPWAGKHDG